MNEGFETIRDMADRIRLLQGQGGGWEDAAEGTRDFLLAILDNPDVTKMRLYLGTGVRERLRREVWAGREADHGTPGGPTVSDTVGVLTKLIEEAEGGDDSGLYEFLTQFVLRAGPHSLAFFLTGVRELFKSEMEENN